MLKIGLVVVGLVIGALLLISCGQQRRRAALEQAALGLGLRYQGEASESEGASWRQLPSIAPRQQNFFTHVMQGGDTAVFDWTWRDGSPKERNRKAQTVVALRQSGKRLPEFVWTHRGAKGRPSTPGLGEALSFPDAPGFSDRFELRGADPAALRAGFDAVGGSRIDLPQDLQVEGDGEWLIGYYPGRLLEPVEIDGLLRVMRGLGPVFR